MELIYGLGIGTAFGFILRWSSVTECACIRDSLALKDFHMLKLLMAAVAVGMMLIFPLSLLGIINFSIKTTYVLGVALGGLIFGVGMGLAGFCPGTVLAALPEGGRNVFWTLAGGLAGAFAYTLAYEPLKPILIQPLNFGKLTLPQVLGTDPVVTALLLGALILAVLFGIDWVAARRQPAGGLPDLADLGRTGND